MSLPDEQKVEEALHFLAKTDEPYANAKALVDFLSHKIKSVRAQSFLDTEGTVAERDSVSLASKEYLSIIEDHKNAVYDRELLAARRKRAELTIDVWRTIQANRRQG